MDEIDYEFIQTAQQIMKDSPVAYVRDAKLRGSVFSCGEKDNTHLVSGVDTEFFVDHAEPEEALMDIHMHGSWTWPLGGLPEGHEFLLLFENRKHLRRKLP